MPATTMSEFGYSFMFDGCTSLTEAPALPATTLAASCYESMFINCQNLVSAPQLLATTLADCCYKGMFERCTELHELVCLATDISAKDCTKEWFLNGSTSGTFYKAPEMEDWPLDTIDGVPTGWTVVDFNAVDEQQDQMVIYPNPVVDKLHINGSDIQSVKVFDMQGRLVHSVECGHADQVEVDFQDLTKGIYIVSILSEGKVVNQQVVF